MARPEIVETTFEFVRGEGGRVWERSEGEEAAVQKRKAGTWLYTVEKRRSKDERSRKVEVVVAATVTVVLGIGNRVLTFVGKLSVQVNDILKAGGVDIVETMDYPVILSKIKHIGCLEKVWNVKLLVNGKEIMSVLQLKSGWPLIREWQKKLMAACPSLCDGRGMPWLDEANLLKACKAGVRQFSPLIRATIVSVSYFGLYIWKSILRPTNILWFWMPKFVMLAVRSNSSHFMAKRFYLMEESNIAAR
ncbi:hypothetical protein Patl1_37301 [Pistacia atlantica]|nr:hypothetical protein Patl1_37301 [Pistacia atlantica]